MPRFSSVVSRPVSALLVVLALAFAVASVGGCSSTPTGSGAPAASSPASGLPASSRLIGPEEFARRVADPAVVTINVHVPDEGQIAGTDLVIPYDRIGASTDLPADLATPLAVYCRTGHMSSEAVATLRAKGYTDVVELVGGFNAWTASGRALAGTP